MYCGFKTFKEFYDWYSIQDAEFQRTKLELISLTTTAGHILSDDAKQKAYEASWYIKQGQAKLKEMWLKASTTYVLNRIYDNLQS